MTAWIRLMDRELGIFSWIFLILSILGPRSIMVSSSSETMPCKSTKLVVYKVSFSTFWDRQKFPKQYPEFRPPAQWSKLIGFSHQPEYHLFRLGEESSLAVKEFAETASTDILDKQKAQLAADSHLEHAKIDDFVVLDVFSSPPIESGVGTSKGTLFVDGNHTRVSMMAKLIPSPDWFVGLDSLNLCENGHFVDTVTIEADPMDAGTDNGFTFTSPNWPTSPQGSIFRITNVYPDHPAGSFNYPEKPSLPTIAKFTFIKEKEFELSEVFDVSVKSENKAKEDHLSQVNKYAYQVDDHEDPEDTVVTFVPTSGPPSKKKKKIHHTKKDHDDIDEKTNEIPMDNNDLLSAVKLSSSTSKKRARSGYHSSTGPGDFMKKTYTSNLLSKATDVLYKESKDELYRKLLETYEEKKRTGLSTDLLDKLKRRRRLRRMRHQRRSSKRHRGPVNCKVGHWSDWSPCSKTCGIGESKRTRKIVRKAKRGGNECPPLVSKRWCGSARNCHGKYFDW